MQRRKKYAKINRIVAIYRFSADKKKYSRSVSRETKQKCREIFRINFGQWNPTVAKKTHERIHSLYETRYTSACNNISFSRSLFTVNVLCCLCIAYLLSWNRWFLWMNRSVGVIAPNGVVVWVRGWTWGVTQWCLT